MGCWVQQKSEEISLFTTCDLENQRAEVRLVGEKIGPVGGGIFGSESEPRAVSGSKVREGAGGVSAASGNSAEAARFTGPMTTKPICSISSAEHSKLDSRLSYLMGITMTSGDEGRGDSRGHVRQSQVRDGGEGACLCLQLIVPEGYDCSSDHASPCSLRWRVGQDKKGVLEIVLHTDLTDLEKP